LAIEHARPHPDTHYLKVLLPPPVRWKLAANFAGSVAVSLIETASILLLLPLMQTLSGQTPSGAFFDILTRMLGTSEQDVLIGALLLAVVVGFIVKDAFTLVFRWWVSGFTARLQVATSARIFEHLLKAPYAVHLKRGTADMMRSVGDAVSMFYGRVVSGTLGAATELVTIFTILVAMLALMPLPTLSALAYFGVASLLFIRIIRPRVAAVGERQIKASSEAFEWFLRGFGGIKEIQLRHAQDHFVAGYRTWSLRGALAGRASNFLAELPKYLLEVLFIIGLAIVILLLTLTGSSTSLFGMLAVLAAAAFRILPSIIRFLSNVTTARSGVTAQELLFDELAREESYQERAPRPTNARLPFTRSLELQDVTFQYEDADEPVLRGVSLSVPAGTSVAIVGGRGAGKTTLANIILGLLSPTGGRILVDGVGVDSHLSEWQNNLAIVPQEVYLMDTSLANNIAFDKPDDQIDRARLQRAVRQAQLTDFVESVPGGLDARFGERGSRLSGGQRQRIGIARALYREPLLLLLDEATSALDNETERRITDTIHALHGQVTLIVIAHRLSTVRDADVVVLLEQGRVVDAGTFDELRTRNADFAHLVELGDLSAEAGLA